MSALPEKVQNFLKQVENTERPSAEEQKKALQLALETLHEKNIYLRKKSVYLNEVVVELKTARLRLDEARRRLELSAKSGVDNNTVH